MGRASGGDGDGETGSLGAVPEPLDDLAYGQHVCWMYGDDGELRSGLVPFITDGLTAHQRVACFDRAERLDDIRVWLEDAGLAVDDLVTSGRLMIGDAESAYFEGGSFDRVARVEGFRRLLVESVAAGYLGLRVFGEVGFMAGAAGMTPWASYEIHADVMMARLPLIGVCGYDTRSLDDGELTFLRSLHTRECGDPGSTGVSAPSFRVSAARTPAPSALHLEGEVDFSAAGLLQSVLASGATARTDLVLDISALTFIDTAGLTAVAQARDTAARVTGDAIPIRGASPMVRQMWAALGFDASLLEAV